MTSKLLEGELQIAHLSKSVIQPQIGSFLMEVLSFLRDSESFSTYIFSLFTRLKANLWAVFFPIPGSFDNKSITADKDSG